MRPDQHKQKRSAQYKKKHGTASKNEGAKKGENSTECVKSGEVLREDESLIPAAKYEEGDRTFSRRKVLSNWDRYDDICGSSDDDENINVTSVKKRGEDFTTLVEKAAKPESQFRFQAEQEWEGTGEVSLEPATSALEINFGTLAACLQSVPLHERLGIQDDNIYPDILDQFQWDTGISQEPQQISSDKAAISYRERHTEISRGMSSLQKRSQVSVNERNDTCTGGISMTVCNKTPASAVTNGSVKELNAHDPLLQTNTGLHITYLKDVLEAANVMGQTDIDDCTQPHQTNTELQHTRVELDKDEQDEDELEFLLSLDTPAEQSQSQGHSVRPAPEQNQVPLNISNQKGQLQMTDKEEASKLASSDKDDGDLEDWLDSVLG